MQNEVKGQARANALLMELSREGAKGRTIIFHGERGVGKFTTALSFARELLQQNPFMTTEFHFYRNDDFSLKTEFFLRNSREIHFKQRLIDYFFYLSGRLSAYVAYDKPRQSSLKLERIYPLKGGGAYKIEDFRGDFEEILLNEKLMPMLHENKDFCANLRAVSMEMSKKQWIPIDFIRSIIEFHRLKSSRRYRISVIGDFDNATEEAQNSSLKLLEEPPAQSFIILTVTNLKAILPTILSRSIVIQFNRLNNHILSEIFGQSTRTCFSTTVDYMQDAVFQYAQKRREAVLRFFRRVAPEVAKSNCLFEFIAELSESETMVLLFLRELLEFFRQTHLARQAYIRNADFAEFIDSDYSEIFTPLLPAIHSAELASFSKDIDNTIAKIVYHNAVENAVLPSLLLSVSRWYLSRRR